MRMHVQKVARKPGVLWSSGPSAIAIAIAAASVTVTSPIVAFTAAPVSDTALCSALCATQSPTMAAALCSSADPSAIKATRASTTAASACSTAGSTAQHAAPRRLRKPLDSRGVVEGIRARFC